MYLYSDFAENFIAVLMCLYFLLMLLSKPNYDLLAKRMAICFALKGISQFLTIVPQPSGVEECSDASFFEFKNCADMMFSGHTCLTYLLLYKTKLEDSFLLRNSTQSVCANRRSLCDELFQISIGKNHL